MGITASVRGVTVRCSPLVLAGGPAVGKTLTNQALAETTPRAAYGNVDDLGQPVRTGAVAPRPGSEGAAQHLLGVQNEVRPPM